MSRVFDAIAEVQRYAEKNDEVMVMYSGGKDSIPVLDLCVRAGFKRVEAAYMAMVPGMRTTQEILQAAESRYGIRMHEVTNWKVYKHLNGGKFGARVENGIKAGLKTTYAELTRRTGINLFATGCRKAEGFERAAAMKVGAIPGWHPIRDWVRADVVGYIKSRGIAVPENDGRKDQSDIGLNNKSILWLYDHYPDDFALMEKAFPFIRGVVARRKFFQVA